MTTEKRYGYIALFGDRRHELYAGSLYEAQQRAVEHFKPARSKRHLVSVTLAEVDGQVVTHRAVD